MALLLPQPHEHAWHQRKVERHVALVAFAEVGTDVGRPLVRLGEQDAAGVLGVELSTHHLQDIVRFGQVLVDRPLALDEIGDRVETERVDAKPEPEAHDVDNRVPHLRVVEVQVRLM